jgi:hypothetical protein
MIERRDEDVYAGLARLTSTLATCTEFGTEHLADAVLARLGPPAAQATTLPWPSSAWKQRHDSAPPAVRMSYWLPP